MTSEGLRILQISKSIREKIRQWHNLIIGKDGLLRRESGPYKHLVLPSKFHRNILMELHQEMGHLGAKRVVQLAMECFYWPRIERDITHFVTNVRGCLKQRKPYWPVPHSVT